MLAFPAKARLEKRKKTYKAEAKAKAELEAKQKAEAEAKAKAEAEQKARKARARRAKAKLASAAPPKSPPKVVDLRVTAEHPVNEIGAQLQGVTARVLFFSGLGSGPKADSP